MAERDYSGTPLGKKLGLDNGLVDNKSCAIDEDWTAVRFVYRLKDR